MVTATTKPTTDILSKLEEAAKRRIGITNLVLLVLLAVFLLLDVNKGWFRTTSDANYEIFISATITGLVAALAIIIPLRIQRQAAIKTLSMVVSSELYRNLSELEYADQEFKKDYTQQPPFTGAATQKDRQTMEMSKTMGAAARLDAALEDTAYNGMMSSRIMADIDQSLAKPIIEAYTGIASARQTTKHFADFFSKLLDAEAARFNSAFTEHSRQYQVDKAIERVKEDVCIAIGQINKAIKALNDELKQYGQKYSPVYRDELLEKYGCGKGEKDKQ